jgi:hypothetical protein
MNEKPKQYHLETIGAMALAKPAENSAGFIWTESKSEDGKKRFWYSEDEVFHIEDDPAQPENPFVLVIHIMGDKSCSAGPFHSLAAAQEAANRIWNYMRQGKIHHSQLSGGGHFWVISRQLFPNL